MAETKEESIAATLADTVAICRRERGMTQEALSALSGFDPTYLSRLERGRSNPTLNTLERISHALDMRLSELVARAEEMRTLRSAGTHGAPGGRRQP